ncbi:MAG: type I-E CRISPR-associated protein Cse1/CasA [Rubrivivax sp.]|nr:type I-E CRISPR-associated protein Cse1/CasA [Rubrivivax sp.]
MNLLQDPWMPVRDAQGRREWIAPDRLGEPRWRAFDADRADFNGALAQFAIGLLQTTTPAADVIEWRRMFRQPPDAAALRAWFGPVHAAFVLDGDGARFMQDVDLGSEGVATNGVGALLIESPGEQTLKNNADHFVKRGQLEWLCAACAATALFTLQTNAPSGGAGHRTGLRGGGPLSTLVMAPGGASLWQHLWLNVRDQPGFLAQGGDADLPMGQRAFPWLGPITALQPLKGELAMAQVHPAHHFWAMPRRIRLEFESAGGSSSRCDLCGCESGTGVRRYATKNYGLNYKGEWNHPLSPYRLDPKEGWLPLHPQPDGLGYRHWLAWVLGVSGERRTTRVAPVVTRAVQHLRGQTGPGLRLWAFGYDMDNMKARCWYESTLPLYGLADCEPDAVAGLQAEVSGWLAGAELAAQYLRGAVKDAWFGHEARGDFAHVDAAFWSATEAPFYRRLQAAIESARCGNTGDPLPARESWHRTLAAAALRLFDEVFVGTGPVERQNPRRAAMAHRQLVSSLHGPKIKAALGLPLPPSTDKPRRARAAKAGDTNPKEPA